MDDNTDSSGAGEDINYSGNAALDGIQRNMNALRTSAEQQLNIAGKVGAASDYILPTTRPTGQVVSGANAQLNRHPDVLPGETDTARSRVIHTVRDSFRDQDLISLFNGKPAAFVKVYRIGNEQVLSIVDTVQNYLDSELRPKLPQGTQAIVWRDDAEELEFFSLNNLPEIAFDCHNKFISQYKNNL